MEREMSSRGTGRGGAGRKVMAEYSCGRKVMAECQKRRQLGSVDSFGFIFFFVLLFF